MTAVFRDFYGIFKIRIGIAIALSAVAGLAVTPGISLPAWQVAVLGFAALGASAAAGAFNQLIERDLDARMARTQKRPFVTGRYRGGAVWYLGVLLLLTGSVTIAGVLFNPLVAVYLFLGAFTYGVVYTVWLKKRTPWNIVIGGLSGTFAVLERGSRVIFAHTLVLVAVSLLPGLFGYGPIYLSLAALGGGYFLYRAWRHVEDPTPATAMKAFFASLGQLTLVLIGAMAEGGFLAGLS